MSNTLGKNAAVLTASKIITTLISLVSAMLLSRFRTLREYGAYSQILLVVTLATSLFTLGLPNSTNYFLALSETHEDRQRFLSVYCTFSTLLCILMGIVLAVSVPLIVSFFHNEMIREFVYVLVTIPWTRVIISSISNILVVYGKTERLTLFNVINAAVALAAVLITQLADWGFREYMFMYLLGETGMAVSVYIIVWRLEKPLKISLDRELIAKLLHYSVPIGIAGLVGTVSIEIDKLMIGHFFDTEQLAIYTNAAKELPLTIVASSLTAVLLPQMARMLKAKDNRGAVELWGNTIRLSYIIICFCATALVVFAPQIITILYSKKYLPGVSVFRVYSLVLLLRTTYFGLVLNSIGKTKLIFYSSLASLALNAALNYLFFLMFGMVGPAIATFASILCVNLGQLLYTAKELNVPFKNIFPWKKLLEITIVNAVWGVIAYAVVQLLNLGVTAMDIGISIVVGFVFLAVYCLLMRKPCLHLWKKLNAN